MLDIIVIVSSFALLVFLAAALITLAQRQLADKDEAVIERVNALLPQTQCAQCGYPGCRPYAEAIVRQGAAIDLCPPGGDACMQSLATLLDKTPAQLSDPQPSALTAVIREEECIGCTLCIEACPVDAIIGAAQFMHVVIAERCTGCELCVAPCPVDCIDMQTTRPSASSKVLKPAPALPCIQCNACDRVCPENLDVQMLYHLSDQERFAQAAHRDLHECIECEACDTVCPSEIPLTALFRYAKQEDQQLAMLAACADIDRQRYEQHEHRTQAAALHQRQTIAQQKADLKAQAMDKERAED